MNILLALGVAISLMVASIGYRALDGGERERVQTDRRQTWQLGLLVRRYHAETHAPIASGPAGVWQVLTHFEPKRARAHPERYLDPWGRPYRIEVRPLAGARSLCVVSAGADGRPGGDGYAEDSIQLCYALPTKPRSRSTPSEK